MQFFNQKHVQILIGIFALIGVIAIIGKVVRRSTQYVALCENATFASCEMKEAEFTYDSGDGQFVIRSIKLSDRDTRNYTATECWVKPLGSSCMNSSLNKNDTSDSFVIVPLASHQ